MVEEFRGIALGRRCGAVEMEIQRKAGVPVAELAKKHGISTAYIYMLR
jgi:hypothetical protein